MKYTKLGDTDLNVSHPLAGVKHWHGAAPDAWFSHLAIEVEGEEAGTEWLEAVADQDYRKLK